MSNYSCRICRSEYREDIEKLLSQKLSYRDIAKQHIDSFDCDLHLLEQSIGIHQKKHISHALTAEEMTFLGRLQRGEVGLDEASRVVAVRVFENMLRNPHDVKFIDFFRVEYLRMKQEENRVKDQWSKEVIARFFAGKLPNAVCSHCGKSTVESENNG